MSPSPTTEAGPAQRYLYAITEAGALDNVSLDGIEDEPVLAVEADGLAVAASPLGRDDVRPRRRHLKAHHDTINALTEHGAALLPMSFGVVAESPTQLRRFLTRNQERLRQQIDRLRNRVEIECRVAWQVDDLFQYFVDRHETLREARDEYYQGGDREPSRAEKVHLGELFDECRAAERAEHQATVEEHLREVADAVEADECSDDEEVARLACLVHRDRVDDLEAAIYNAAKAFDEEFLFEYTDPTAPYTFANIEF
jgi:hypothetical protein